MKKNKNLKKLVYISSIAAPHQIKFCNCLQKYYNAKFIFYDYPDSSRGGWWRVDLGENSEVLRRVYFKTGFWNARYYSPFLVKRLDKLNPDILIIGGFSIPSNYIAYRWAKKNNKKVIVFTERSRSNSGKLRKMSILWRILSWLYRDIDLVLVSAEDAVMQFKNEFGFGEKVIATRYAADIDDYFNHPVRSVKDSYTYIYANRLTEIYNPIMAIEIFYEILKKYPTSKLLMNNSGEMREKCLSKIKELNINSHVKFLDNLSSWSDLGEVYAKCDILILPAKFSNGNFTILEAMASGMGIVISNKILGVGNLIEDGKNGFNRTPDIYSFVSAIEEYISDGTLFEKHSKINRAITRQLSGEGTAEMFHEILIKLDH